MARGPAPQQTRDGKEVRDHRAMEERLEWGQWVTGKPLATKPIHRWLTFPHSFTNDLVHALIEEWSLTTQDYILDPFVGAGTTVLSSKEKDISAKGYDLSPLAVFATRVKTSTYDLPTLKSAWKNLNGVLGHAEKSRPGRVYPPLVEQALPGELLSAFANCDQSIETLGCSPKVRDFLRLGLIAIIPQFSRAQASGGWLKWTEETKGVESFNEALKHQMTGMLDDQSDTQLAYGPRWGVELADARSIPESPNTFTALITSPPYPNRHDYTRIFAVELLFRFLTPDQNCQLRRQSLHSHPEAKPARENIDEYSEPEQLVQTLTLVRSAVKDMRVYRMLKGYFLDIFLCLREARRVCKPGARIALVVGNVQYCGIPVLVDEITSELGQQAGLESDGVIIARYRGNSAQQMGQFGRRPSRESVVLLRRPKETDRCEWQQT